MENSILIDKNLIIRSGTDGEDLSFELPKEKAGQSFWIKATEGISFYMRHSDNQSGKRVINISAINNSDEANNRQDYTVFIGCTISIEKESNILTAQEGYVVLADYSSIIYDISNSFLTII